MPVRKKRFHPARFARKGVGGSWRGSAARGGLDVAAGLWLLGRTSRGAKGLDKAWCHRLDFARCVASLGLARLPGRLAWRASCCNFIADSGYDENLIEIFVNI